MLATFYLTAIGIITGAWYLKSAKKCTKDALVGIRWSVCVDGEWGGIVYAPTHSSAMILKPHDVGNYLHQIPNGIITTGGEEDFFFIIESTKKPHQG